MAEPWPFGALPLFGFDLLMVDPPWEFRLWSDAGAAKSPQAQYKTMPLSQIRAMPIGQLAAQHAVCILWGTWPLMLDGGDPGRGIIGDASFSPLGSCLKAWGFYFVTGGAWFKRTRHGKAAFGTGYRLRSSCEPFLIGMAGSPHTPGASKTRNAIEGLRREHSRKPDEAYEIFERYMPDARRLDLFSRQQRPGWTNWGDEADKFNGGKIADSPENRDAHDPL